VARGTGAQLDSGGRVMVNPDCTVPGHPEIFIIGDLAHFEQDGRPLTGVAQVAMQQGRYVARLIQERLRVQKRLRGRNAGKPFRYFDKGELAVIGRGRAVAKIRGLHLSGFIAWLIWLFIHLMYLVEFSNRLLVFVHWGFLYITFDRGARLITGSDRLPAPKYKEEAELETKV
jgi:NADH dehydrogenase